MNRKATSHPKTMNWVMRSRSNILVGSPLCWSTTAIWMYLKSPTNTKTVVR